MSKYFSDRDARIDAQRRDSTCRAKSGICLESFCGYCECFDGASPGYQGTITAAIKYQSVFTEGRHADRDSKKEFDDTLTPATVH